MLDINYIKKNREVVKKAIVDKQLTNVSDVDTLIQTHDAYLKLLQEVEALRRRRNEISSKISNVHSPEERNELVSKAKELKESLKEAEGRLNVLESQVYELQIRIPNVPADDVPVGEDESGNVEVRKVGNIPSFDFTPRYHMWLGEHLGIIDTKRGTKLGGFRSYFLVGEGAILERALLQYGIDFMLDKKFNFMSVPVMVDNRFLLGTGYLPWGGMDLYQVDDNKSLIGTAEVSLTSYYADEVFNETDLPLRLVGISPCFRKEVGSYGKDTKGIFRVHYFNKVEQVVLLPEGEDLTREWHERMLGYSEEFLKSLGLPYRVLLMCTGDMGASQRKKYDIETWMPSQNTYRETHSASYFLDFQARRLNMRYRTSSGTKFVNTLNNTVVATPRLLAILMENYQQEDGSILIPEVLWPYTKFKSIEPKK